MRMTAKILQVLILSVLLKQSSLYVHDHDVRLFQIRDFCTLIYQSLIFIRPTDKLRHG